MTLALAINTGKTTEAIALLLKLHQKPMILSQLLKLMYFIDLQFLVRTNRSLTNDSYLGKQSGLIPKHIPKLVEQLQSEHLISTPANSSGYIALKRQITSSHLSSSEIAIVTAVYHQKKDINPFNLLDWNYNLEFIKNHVKTKRTILITPLDMMRSLEKTEAEIQAYLDTQTVPSTTLSVA